MTSQIRVDEITNRSGLGTVTIYDNGFEFTGVTTFTEDVDITGGLTIGGVLTYEDVTNIDSVGLITARNGLNVTGGSIGIGENNPQNSLHISGSVPAIRFEDSGANGSAFSIIEDNNGLLKLRNDAGNAGTGSGIAFEVDAAERVRITSAGTVNIGDQGLGDEYLGSTVKIRKDQNSVTRLSVRNENSGSGSASAIQVGAYGNSWMLQCGSAANDSNAFTIRVDGSSNSNTGTEKLRITTAGLVGIGEDSPDRLLHIKGASSTAYSGGSDTADYNFLKIENTTNDKSAGIFFAIGSNGEAAITATEVADGNTDIAFQNRGGGVRSEKLRITYDGKVGIGENNPSTVLHVAGSLTLENSSATGNAWTYYKNADRTWLVGVRGSSNDALSFYDLTTDVERLRIDSSGKVGIPVVAESSALLGINGSSTSELTDSSGLYNQGNPCYLQIKNSTDSISDPECGIILQPRNSANGSVAIYAKRTGSYTSDLIYRVRTGSSTSAERLRIKNNGNVGINESNPRAKLDVRGTALIADDIGSTLPSTFPASDVQLMVYTSTNGQPITNTNCARILLATDAKQTGPQGYHGAIDFGSSDCTASGNPAEYNYRLASIMSNASTDTSSSNVGEGNLEFWTKTQNGSLSKKMDISAEGYVTKTNQPCFDAVRNSGHMSANTYINYNTVKANNGGHYNSSNGRFTAPVAGYYFFSWTSIKNNTNTVTRLYIHKNGSSLYGNRHLRLDAGQDYGDNGTMTAVVQLAVNDYVQIYLGAGSIYGVTEEYCIFNGYLIG